jgi:hypothetical protein
MPPETPKQNKPVSNKKGGAKRMLKGLVVLLLLAAVAFFVVALWGNSTPPPASEGSSVPELDFSVLNQESFLLFKLWSSIPIVVGETGKENPFGEGE